MQNWHKNVWICDALRVDTRMYAWKKSVTIWTDTWRMWIVDVRIGGCLKIAEINMS